MLQADPVLHQLSQLIAKATRAYVPVQDDDSHTNLAYDALGDRLLGRWIQAGENALLPALRLHDQAVIWYDDQHEELLVMPTIGRALQEVEEDIARLLPELGLDPKPFAAPMHYDMPEYDLGEVVPVIAHADLNAWRSYRSHANMTCHLLLEHLQVGGEVRIWPHHFDTGIYVKPNARMGLGFGLAPSDDFCDVPYYYVAGYPEEGQLDYKAAPELDAGHWSDHGFRGAHLPGESAPDPVSLDRFVRQSVSWLLAQS